MNIEIWLGDITTLAVDVIVNAANSSLLGGGGVDGAIHHAAGPALRAECVALPELRHRVRCPPGEVRVTGAHSLPARHVFHTVGPVWRGGQRDEAALLANCYWRCLQEAHQRGLESIAFPSISCGSYGFPLHAACRIAAHECASWQRSQERPVRIVLVAHNLATQRALEHALREQHAANSTLPQPNGSSAPLAQAS